MHDGSFEYRLVRNRCGTIRQSPLEWDDFEDAAQFACGESLNVYYAGTRNKDYFVAVSITVMTPEELIRVLSGD